MTEVNHTSATAASPMPVQRGVDEATRSADPWWTSCARAAIVTLAGTGRNFSADDVRDLGVTDPHHPNQWGSVFACAHRDGLIAQSGFTVSRRPQRSGGVLRTWRGVR